MTTVRHLFKVRPGEGSQFAILFLYYFCLVAITIAGKTVRDSYFLSRYDRGLLALMSGAAAAAVALSVAAYSWLSTKVGLRMATHLTSGLFAGSLILLQARIQGVLIPTFYVWIEVIFVIVTLQFWLLAPLIFDSRQAKRLFGPIAGGGSLGAVATGFAMKPFVRAWGIDPVLYLVALLIGLTWILAIAASRYADHTEPAPAPAGTTPAKRQLDKYLTTIAVAISMAAIATTIVEYQFKIFAGQAYPQERDLVSFFGSFYAATGFSTLLAQFALTGLVLSRFGVLAGLLVLPLLLGTGSVAILLYPSLASATAAKFSDQTFKFTLTNSTMELLWLPVSAVRRLAAKPFVTGTVKSASEAAAAVALHFLAKGVALHRLSWVALGAVIVWAAAAFRLRALYVREIAEAIENRKMAVAELTVDVGDPVMVRTIRDALMGGQEEQVLFALRLMEGLPARHWAQPLQSLLMHGSVPVKKRVLEVAGDDTNAIPDLSLITAVAANDDASADAFLAAARRNPDRFLSLMRELLDSPNPELRAAAAAVLRTASPSEAERATEVLASMLHSDDPDHVSAAIPYVSSDTATLPQARLVGLLQSRYPPVRSAALRALGERRDPQTLRPIVQSVGEHSDIALIRQVLKRFPSGPVVSALTEEMTAAPTARKAALMKAMADYPSAATANHLLAAIDPLQPDLSETAADSLIAIARRHPPDDEINAHLSAKLTELAEHGYFCTRVITLLPAGPDALLLRDYYRDRLQRIRGLIMKAAAIRRPTGPIETCVRILSARDSKRLGFVLELLEGLLTRDERRFVDPLLEAISRAERDKAGAELFPNLPRNLPDVLIQNVSHGQDWIAAVSFDYISRLHPELLKRVDPQRKQRNPLIAETLARTSGDSSTMPSAGATMYTTLEKAVFLKSVSLFQKIPAERISDLAQVAVETRVPAGTTLFREGDHGDSLYLVVEGGVRVHKAGQELAVLGKGGCVGEMSLLDQEPRSADVTTTEDSTLLRIGQEEFYDVLRRNQEVVQGVIGLLTSRLRTANANLTGTWPAVSDSKPQRP